MPSFLQSLAYPNFTCQSSFYNSPLLVIDNSELTQPNYCKPTLLCQLMERFATKFAQVCNVSVWWEYFAYNSTEFHCCNAGRSQFLFLTGAGALLFPTELPKAALLCSAVSPYKFACKVYLSTSITLSELINWEHNLSLDLITIITRQKLPNFITLPG